MQSFVTLFKLMAIKQFIENNSQQIEPANHF